MNLKKSYKEWHNHPDHHHVHWGVFLLSCLVACNILIGAINETYLADFSVTKAEASGEPLLQPGDLVYRGFFRLRTEDVTFPCNITTSDLNVGIGFNPTGDSGRGSLVLGWAGELMAEVSIPTDIDPTDDTMAEAPAATVIQPCTRYSLDHHAADIQGGAGSTSVTGILVRPNSILVGMTAYFGSPVNNNGFAHIKKTFSTAAGLLSAWSGITIDGTSGTSQRAACSDIYGGLKCATTHMNNGFTPIPANHQAAMGGDTLGYGAATNSAPIGGPISLISFYADDVGVVDPAPGNRILTYTHQELGAPILGNVKEDRPYWAGNSTAGGVVWINGTKSVIWFQVEGTPHYFGYAIQVGYLDAEGYVSEPVARDIQASGATVSSDGYKITFDNSACTGYDCLEYQVNHAIWLKDQSLPIRMIYNRPYKAVSHIVSQTGSGTANAVATVDIPFTAAANATGQHIQIGDGTLYDPTHFGTGMLAYGADVPHGNHGPHAYPYTLRAYAYNSDDFEAVKAGTKQFYEPLPYATWELTDPIKFMPSGDPLDVAAATVDYGGAAIDMAHNRIYLVKKSMKSTNESIVTVWDVATTLNPTPPAAPYVSFSANPNPTPSGSSTLYWSSSNATSCTASGGWSGAKATSGNQAVSITNNTTAYSLTCTGPGGTTIRSVNVLIFTTPNPTPTPGPTPTPPTPSPSPTPNTPIPAGTPVATDNFNRTDTYPIGGLGANWTQQKGTSFVIGNTAGVSTFLTDSAFWNANTFANDQYSKISIIGSPSTHGIIVRASGTDNSQSFYGANVYATFGYKLYKVVNGVATLLVQDLEDGFVQDDTIELRVLGNLLSVYKNNTLLGSYTDKSSPLTSGRPGINGSWPSDNWEGGNIGSTTTLAGDLNHDNIVNSLDWSLMNSKWFTSDANADLNHDGLVNAIDFSLLNTNWFKTT